MRLKHSVPNVNRTPSRLVKKSVDLNLLKVQTTARCNFLQSVVEQTIGAQRQDIIVTVLNSEPSSNPVQIHTDMVNLDQGFKYRHG